MPLDQMTRIDEWLGDYPDGQVRFDALGVEFKCTLEPSRGDCYFGHGLTSRLAFDAALRALKTYGGKPS